MCGLEHLVLRQETYAADVGWFVQNQVALEADQVAGLKMSLSTTASARSGGLPGTSSRGQSPAAVGRGRRPHPSAAPVILRFEAAS